MQHAQPGTCIASISTGADHISVPTNVHLSLDIVHRRVGLDVVVKVLVIGVAPLLPGCMGATMKQMFMQLHLHLSLSPLKYVLEPTTQ